MTTAVSNKKSVRINAEYVILSLFCAAFVLLLFMRDYVSIEVNKYIFVLMACVAVITLKSDKVILLLAFLSPLFVGLPGNYIEFVFLIRFLFDYKKIKVKTMSLVFAVLVSVYIFVQNVVTEYTSIIHMMFIFGVFIVLLMFSYQIKIDTQMLALFYVLGVAAMGLIMLLSTLRVFDISYIMNTSARLGTSNANYAPLSEMKVSMDPNYYGLFAISALSVAFPQILRKEGSLIYKILLLAAAVSCMIVAFMGLSRAFLIVIIAWLFLYIISQRKISTFIVSVLAFIALMWAIFRFFPDVMDTMMNRFSESDMDTFNGRTLLIEKFSKEFFSSVTAFLFGVGMYICNVHCMPLQYLFGGGIIFTLLMLLFVLSFVDKKRIKNARFAALVPMIVAFAMSLTVPIATLFFSMFPFVVIGLINKHSNQDI